MATSPRFPVRRCAVFALASLFVFQACAALDEALVQWEAAYRSTDANVPAGASGAVPWRHELGVELDVPAGWEIVPSDDSSAFLPPGARIDDSEAHAVCSFVFIEAPGARPLDSLVAFEGAAADVALLGEFLRNAEEHEFVPLADRPGIALGFDTREEGLEGRIELYATLHEGRIVGLLAAGERAWIDEHRASLRGMFQSLRFGAEGRAGGSFEPAPRANAPQAVEHVLVGRWTHSEGYASGGFSIATETTLALGGDGRYRMSSSVAGGDFDNAFDGGDSAEVGVWSVAGGELRLAGDSGGTSVYSWRIVDGTLVLTDGSGNTRYFE